LAPRVWVRVYGSLRPRPPLDLGRQTISHATKAYFFLFLELPHRKSLLRFHIALRIYFRAAITKRWYIDIAWRTDSMRMSLLVMLREQKAQLSIFFSILSGRSS
jgi:hypothetical protein